MNSKYICKLQSESGIISNLKNKHSTVISLLETSLPSDPEFVLSRQTLRHPALLEVKPNAPKVWSKLGIEKFINPFRLGRGVGGGGGGANQPPLSENPKMCLLKKTRAF